MRECWSIFALRFCHRCSRFTCKRAVCTILFNPFTDSSAWPFLWATVARWDWWQLLRAALSSVVYLLYVNVGRSWKFLCNDTWESGNCTSLARHEKHQLEEKYWTHEKTWIFNRRWKLAQLPMNIHFEFSVLICVLQITFQRLSLSSQSIIYYHFFILIFAGKSHEAICLDFQIYFCVQTQLETFKVVFETNESSILNIILKFCDIFVSETIT